MFSRTDIEQYFNAEKSGALVFLLLGVAAVLAAFTCWIFFKTGFSKGVAVPLLLVGLLMAITGYTVYKSSDADRTRNVYAYDMNPDQLKNKELPRMEKVMRKFVIYRWIEISLLVLAIAGFLYVKQSDTVKGAALSLALMALLAFAGDYFAEKRGRVYVEGLRQWVASMEKKSI